MPPNAYDIVVVGSGPAGQKAAIQGAKAGKKVVLIEQEQGIGGNCVYRGTIPSKTLRETALQFERLKRSSEVFEGRLRLDVPMSVLLHRLDEVVKAHECYMADQLTRNSVTYRHGRARFLSPHEVELETIDGACQALRADTIVLATGSRPRSIPEIPVEHVTRGIAARAPSMAATMLVQGKRAGSAACRPAARRFDPVDDLLAPLVDGLGRRGHRLRICLDLCAAGCRSHAHR